MDYYSTNVILKFSKSDEWFQNASLKEIEDEHECLKEIIENIKQKINKNEIELNRIEKNEDYWRDEYWRKENALKAAEKKKEEAKFIGSVTIKH